MNPILVIGFLNSIKIMTELSKILQQEKTQKETVDVAKKKAQIVIDKKKQALSEELQGAGISKEQEEKVLEYKKQQNKETKKTINKSFEVELQELKKKEQNNSAKAAEFVVRSLFKE